MRKYQDIQAQDVALRNQFVTAWLSGNYGQAFNIVQNNPQVKSKAFVAECFNNMFTAVKVLENYFYSGVTEEFSILLTEFNEALNEFVSKSSWDSSVEYMVGNFVVYNNAIYLCIVNNNNIIPTNTQYWVYLGLRGERGAPYINAQIKYQWNSSIEYAIHDVVIIDNVLYIATASSTNQYPPVATNYWEILVTLPKPKIVVSSTPPSGNMLYDGMIWCEIIN